VTRSKVAGARQYDAIARRGEGKLRSVRQRAKDGYGPRVRVISQTLQPRPWSALGGERGIFKGGEPEELEGFLSRVNGCHQIWGIIKFLA